MKKSKVSILSLCTAMVVSASVGIGLQMSSYADEVDSKSLISATTVFRNNSALMTNEANYTDAEGAVTNYLKYALGKTANVQYQRNLALHWMTADGTKQNFSLTVGLQSLATSNFNYYSVKFMSQQYAKTKDGTSVNRLVFVPNTAKTAMYVYVDNSFRDKESDVKKDESFFTPKTATLLEQEGCPTIPMDGTKTVLNIQMGDTAGENTEVQVNGVSVTFKNIGGAYAKYQSTYTTYPCIPLTFSAGFDEASATATDSVGMVLEQLNGQSFKLSGTTTSIIDDTAPVVCLENDQVYLAYKSKVSVSYTTIDVLQSATSKVSYSILRKNDQGEANVSGLEYIPVNDSYASYFIQYENSYLPAQQADDENKIYGYASVKVNVTDTSGKEEDYLLELYASNAETISQTKFIPITVDNYGYYMGEYHGDEFDSVWNADELEDVADQYQASLDELTKDADGNCILNAGSDEYLYLPSVQGLFKGMTDGEYHNGTVTVYKRTTGEGFSSAGSMAYNALSISVGDIATYEICFTFTDLAGNAMYYLDDKGDKQVVTSSNIGEMVDEGLIPSFHFETNFKMPTIDSADDADMAYLDKNYNANSFTVNGISGTYNAATYTLYEYRGKVADFKKDYDALKAGTATAEQLKHFEMIVPASQLTNDSENKADYDAYHAYKWNDSSANFIPQKANTYYVVKCTVTAADGYDFADIVKYSSLYATDTPEALKGETNWFANRNNMIAFILFIIAGLSAIGIVLLFVIKPSDKEDIDVVRSTKGSKKKAKADLD